MKVKVKLEDLDEELMLKRMSVSCGDHNIVTPIKAGTNTTKTKGINEIYKKFKADALEKCLTDIKYDRDTNNEINRKRTHELNIVFTDYSDLQLPKDKHIEALSDLQYPYSDIIVTPIFSSILRSDNLTGDELLTNYNNIINKFIDVTETLNNKTIFGVLPYRMPKQYLHQIIDNYHSKNVTSYIIDVDGLTINPSWIRTLMRILKEYNLIESSLLYSINSGQGKFMKNSSEIPAKDFINIGYGLDVIGLNHIPPRMSSEAWEKIKKDRFINTYRLFNKETYGYSKKTNPELISVGISNRDELKVHNINEQYKETGVLQSKLKEESTLEPYLKTKSQIDDKMIKDIKKVRNAAFGSSDAE